MPQKLGESGTLGGAGAGTAPRVPTAPTTVDGASGAADEVEDAGPFCAQKRYATVAASAPMTPAQVVMMALRRRRPSSGDSLRSRPERRPLLVTTPTRSS